MEIYLEKRTLLAAIQELINQVESQPDKTSEHIGEIRGLLKAKALIEVYQEKSDHDEENSSEKTG
jgi:hypothetical protein